VQGTALLAENARLSSELTRVGVETQRLAQDYVNRQLQVGLARPSAKNFVSEAGSVRHRRPGHGINILIAEMREIGGA
jgi:hypothetical protein